MRSVTLSQEYGVKPQEEGEFIELVTLSQDYGVKPQEEGEFIGLITLAQEYGVGRGRVCEIGTLIPGIWGRKRAGL
jgi:hypothetical protein